MHDACDTLEGGCANGVSVVLGEGSTVARLSGRSWLLDLPWDRGKQISIELEYSKLYNASFEHQSYRVLAMKAAHQAGRCAPTKSAHRQWKKHHETAPTTAHKPQYNFTHGHGNTQMMHELGMLPNHEETSPTDSA